MVFYCSHSLAFATEKFTVVTTFTVIADIAQNVAGDAANVMSITKPGAEIHNYQPTPSDIIKAQRADLVLWNGLNLELWFEKFFENLNDVPDFIVTEGIKPIAISYGKGSGVFEIFKKEKKDFYLKQYEDYRPYNLAQQKRFKHLLKK